MKNFTALSKMAACFVFSLVVSASLSHAQITQGWIRDAAIHVTATTAVADTDLRGTVTTGWDEIVIHNKSSTVFVGVFAIINNRTGEVSGVDTFTEMTIFVPPDSAVTITNENVIVLRHIAESTTADLIIERGEKI